MPRVSDTPGHAIVGRASKLSLAKLKQLMQILSGGNFVATACEFTSIGRSTFDGWRERGLLELERVKELEDVDFYDLMAPFDEEGQNSVDYMWENCPAEGFNPREWPYAVMAIHTDRARAVSEMRALGIITSAFKDSWQSAAWFLERTRPDKYANRTRVGLEGPEPGSTPTVKSIVSLDDLEAKLGTLIDANKS